MNAQIEGKVIQTVSRILLEELTFDRSAVIGLGWASYPILTFPLVPEILIQLINWPTERPWRVAGALVICTLQALIISTVARWTHRRSKIYCVSWARGVAMLELKTDRAKSGLRRLRRVPSQVPPVSAKLSRSAAN